MPRSKPAAIISLEDHTESINMLIYGDSGVGKTVFAGTAPRALFLGTENGTISASRKGSTADLWKIETWEDLQLAYKWLYENPEHGYDWVIMDSITEMQTKALRWILDKAVAENSNRDPDIPAIQDHQKWQNMMKRFIGAFNDLPVNVLWTALTFRNEDEEGDDIILPMLLGKGYQISQWACAQMAVVGYLGVKVKGKGDDREAKRSILFESLPPYFAKDRYGTLGRWITLAEDMMMPEIIALINGDEKEAPKKATRKTAAKKTTTARRRASTPDDDELGPDSDDED